MEGAVRQPGRPDAMRDVVIVGGGPAGSAAATVLADLGRRVVLVEQASGPVPKVGETLPPAALRLLRRLGWVGLLEEGPHFPTYGNASCWGGGPWVHQDFLRDPDGQHGWRLDRAAFDAGARSAALEAGASVRSGTRLAEVEPVEAGRDGTPGGGGWRLGLRVAGASDLARLECRWVLDATGRGGWLARRLGGQRRVSDDLVAFSVRYRQRPGAEVDEDGLTRTESVRDGWWYSALLPGGERLAVFHTDPDLPARQRAKTPEGFAGLLGETTRLGPWMVERGWQPVSEPSAVSAATTRLETMAGEAWAAVGDAALSFDPLSSRGIFNALYTGVRTAEAVDRALDGDRRSLDALGTTLESVFEAYLDHRRLYYGEEARWPEAPFWLRRR